MGQTELILGQARASISRDQEKGIFESGLVQLLNDPSSMKHRLLITTWCICVRHFGDTCISTLTGDGVIEASKEIQGDTVNRRNHYDISY